MSDRWLPVLIKGTIIEIPGEGKFKVLGSQELGGAPSSGIFAVELQHEQKKTPITIRIDSSRATLRGMP